MTSPTDILRRISPLAEVAGYARVEHLLRQPATQYHDGGSGNRMSVKQVDHAWGTRLTIARNKGLPPAPGSEHLVASVSHLPMGEMLEYVIFVSGEELAALWFLETTGEPVGFVVVERNMLNGVPVPL